MMRSVTAWSSARTAEGMAVTVLVGMARRRRCGAIACRFSTDRAPLYPAPGHRRPAWASQSRIKSRNQGKPGGQAVPHFRQDGAPIDVESLHSLTHRYRRLPPCATASLPSTTPFVLPNAAWPTMSPATAPP
ncbi:hypothetical protein CBM2594_A40880 [Cupriavidus taiwanensis]|uniref:Uncharacterized protein n=1 Tax=Cupriavidus taiwanensis TaxID=164546 RepID=A0A7Z7NM25_9BURK|nr:hypothetical protein CBM2594_A40880 [Cupriavidus taiwanensis]